MVCASTRRGLPLASRPAAKWSYHIGPIPAAANIVFARPHNFHGSFRGLGYFRGFHDEIWMQDWRAGRILRPRSVVCSVTCSVASGRPI